MQSDEPPPVVDVTQPARRATVDVGPGDLLGGRYRLGSRLGSGGSADVHAAADELLGRDVAVKVFKAHLSDPVDLARQRSEMRLLAQLDHSHLVTVHDAWVPPADNRPDSPPAYLVMELVAGGTLADRLAAGPLAEPAVRDLALAMGEALALVHAGNLVHRDVKPANILFTDRGVAKLSDFGIARAEDATHVTAGQDVIGTAAYLSPEQVTRGYVGAPTDVYALGLVLLECLTGRREFPGPAWESAPARLRRSPTVPAGLPAPWPTLLSAMTADDPADRPTATRLGVMLQPVPGDGAVTVRLAGPTGVVPVTAPTDPGSVTDDRVATVGWGGPPDGTVSAGARRRRAWWAVAGTAVVAAALTAVVITQSAESPATAPTPPVSDTARVETTAAPTPDPIPSTADAEAATPAAAPAPGTVASPTTVPETSAATATTVAPASTPAATPVVPASTPSASTNAPASTPAAPPDTSAAPTSTPAPTAPSTGVPAATANGNGNGNNGNGNGNGNGGNNGNGNNGNGNGNGNGRQG